MGRRNHVKTNRYVILNKDLRLLDLLYPYLMK